MASQELAPSPPSPPAAGDPPASGVLFAEESSGGPSSSGHLFVADSFGGPNASDSPLDDDETQDRVEDSQLAVEGARPVTEEDIVSSGSASPHQAIFDEIVRQVEYYFSDENLPKDVFLLKQVRKNKEDGKRVKRLHPLRVAEVRDEKPRTVLVENLPEDYSEDSIRRIFGTVGHIVGITICNPHSAEQVAALKKADFAISSKLHALVEYDTVEAAENAVAKLNDEMNWRNGMQVQILLKRMEEYGLVQKLRKDVFLEKNNGAEALEMPALNHNGLEKEEGGERKRKSFFLFVIPWIPGFFPACSASKFRQGAVVFGVRSKRQKGGFASRALEPSNKASTRYDSVKLSETLGLLAMRMSEPHPR